MDSAFPLLHVCFVAFAMCSLCKCQLFTRKQRVESIPSSSTYCPTIHMTHQLMILSRRDMRVVVAE